MKRAYILIFFAFVSATLLLSLIGHPHGVLSIPGSELTVKLWVWEMFQPPDLFGKRVELVGWPVPGALNNPDPIGTLTTMLLRPLVGRTWAYNLHVAFITWLNLVSAWSLARWWTRDDIASVVGAVCFAFTPFILLYCIDSAIIDVLNLWPWIFGIRLLLASFRDQSSRRALLSGLLLGVGFLACPYNSVVIAGAIIPLSLVSPILAADMKRELGLGRWSDVFRRVTRVLLLAALPAGLLVAFTVWSLYSVMYSPESQLSSTFVVGTRHTPPYPLIHPSQYDRLFTYVTDFFIWGTGAIVERQAAARFIRAYAPGLVVWAFAILGMFKFPRAWIWVLIAVWAALASTGPYLPLDANHYLDYPWNLAWLLPRRLIPGSTMLMEPFRYVLWVALGLAMACAAGVSWARKRFGKWVPPVALALFIAELLFLLPVPIPLPVTDLPVPEAYKRLNECLPEGPILELPYFVQGGKLFDRRHFYWQLTHGRPIPDVVVGYVPQLMVENQYLATILNIERPYGTLGVRVTAPQRVNEDRLKLVEAGLVGIVVDPELFKDSFTKGRVLKMLEPFGEAEEIGGRLVYRVEGGGR